MEHWRTFDDVMGKLETLAIGNWAPWWPDGEIGAPRPRILFKRFNIAPLHSKRMGPKFLLRNCWCHARWKKIHRGPNSPLLVSYFKDCVMVQCLILVFSVISLDSWGYIGWGLRPGIWKCSFSFFFSSFSFFFSLSFLFFILFSFYLSRSLSWGPPLAPGPLDIVHPCHPVATPLYERYPVEATWIIIWPNPNVGQVLSDLVMHTLYYMLVLTW